MASSDARPIPRKNIAYRVTFPIFDADGDLVTGASGLDSEVSIDGGTFADCTNEATEIATSSGMYYLDLTSGELNGDTVAVIVKTSTSGAKTTPIVLYPEEAGDLRVDVVQISGDTTAADNLESFTDGTGYAGTNNVIPTVTTVTNLTNAPTNGDLTATMKTSVTTAATAATPTVTLADGAITAAKIATGAIDADAIATDAVTEIVAGVWAYVTEGAITAVQVMRGLAAVMMGKSTGGGTTAVAFRDLADSKDRIAATVDTDGNRTAITRDLT